MESLDQFWRDQEEAGITAPAVKKLFYAEEMFKVLSDEGNIIKFIGRGDKKDQIILFAVVKSKAVVSNSAYVVHPSETDFIASRCPLIPISCPRDVSTLMESLHAVR